jgi:hypothetical protein
VEGKDMQLTLEVPCGSTARVVLPATARFAGASPGRLRAGRHQLAVVIG